MKYFPRSNPDSVYVENSWPAFANPWDTPSRELGHLSRLDILVERAQAICKMLDADGEDPLPLCNAEGVAWNDIAANDHDETARAAAAEMLQRIYSAPRPACYVPLGLIVTQPGQNFPGLRDQARYVLADLAGDSGLSTATNDAAALCLHNISILKFSPESPKKMERATRELAALLATYAETLRLWSRTPLGL